MVDFATKGTTYYRYLARRWIPSPFKDKASLSPWHHNMPPHAHRAVTFTSSFQGGTQDGIVVVYMYSQADGSIATATMQKVMLSA